LISIACAQYLYHQAIINSENVTRRTIIQDLGKLKKVGVIKRVGPDKGGYWEINSNLKEK
jgi:predicted HTH transcriptional regulator